MKHIRARIFRGVDVMPAVHDLHIFVTVVEWYENHVEILETLHHSFGVMPCNLELAKPEGVRISDVGDRYERSPSSWSP